MSLALFAGLRPASAQGTGCDGAEWARLNDTELTIWYLRGDEAAARAVAEIAVPAVSYFQPRVYEVFGLASYPQVFLRVYPSESDYRCFNPFEATYPLQPIFGLRGGELSVVLDRLTITPAGLEQVISESVVAALLQLAARDVAERGISDVLMSGIGGYGLRPETVAMAISEVEASDSLALVQLLAIEGRESIDTDAQVHATLLISYLVDVYGWDQFKTFLNRLGIDASPLSALRSVYGNHLQAIEDGWNEYRINVLNGETGHHLLYEVDLSIVEEMINAGSYGDALVSLNQVMPFVRLFESASPPRAAGLKDQAESGLEAIGLLNRARQTLLEGEYLAALQFAEQAEGLFSGLGNDERAEEAENFSAWATDVLSLRAEATYWSSRRGIWSLVAIPRLISVRDDLIELGDSAGADATDAVLNESYRGQVIVMRLGQIVLALISLLTLPKAISGLGSRKAEESRLL